MRFIVRLSALLVCATLQVRAQNSASLHKTERDILALESKIESLEGNRLIGDDIVFIGSDGTIRDKASLVQPPRSASVSERRIRIYEDVAIVTAKQQMGSVAQRYTRVWARRNGEWQVVSFQETTIADGRLATAGFAACASIDEPGAPAGSTERDILTLEDIHTAASTKGETEGTGWLADDYIGINGNGLLADVAFARKLYAHGAPGRVMRFTGRRVRLYGNCAIVTGTSCLRQVGILNPKTGVREGTDILESANRFTRVWAKRDGRWQVVSWQGTPVFRHCHDE